MSESFGQNLDLVGCLDGNLLFPFEVQRGKKNVGTV